MASTGLDDWAAFLANIFCTVRIVELYKSGARDPADGESGLFYNTGMIMCCDAGHRFRLLDSWCSGISPLKFSSSYCITAELYLPYLLPNTGMDMGDQGPRNMLPPVGKHPYSYSDSRAPHSPVLPSRPGLGDGTQRRKRRGYAWELCHRRKTKCDRRGETPCSR